MPRPLFVARRRERSAGRWLEGGLPCGLLPVAGRLPCHWCAHGGAHGKTAVRLAGGRAITFPLAVRSRFAGRAPCAPQWPANACALGKALRKAARGAAPGHVRSIGFPVVRARGAHGKTALRPAMREALAFQWCAHGARTAKLRCAWPVAGRLLFHWLCEAD